MRDPLAHLVLLVLLVSVVLLAQLDPLVFQADPDHRDPQAPPERRERRERKDLKAPLGATASRVQWVCLGLPGLWDPLERTETRERSESLVRREAKERRANTVPPVLLALKAPSDSLVHPELMVSPVPEVSRVCSARRETKAPEASPDPQDPSACRGCQGHQARRERLVMLVRWDPLVLLDPEVPPDPKEQMDPRDPQVASATLALSERRVTLVKQESPDCRETSALRVQEASVERRVNPDLLVLLGLPVPKAPLEMTVLKAVLVQVVSLVTLVLQASLVLLVWMVPQVTREMTEKLVNRVHLDPLVRQVHRAPQEREVPLDLPGLREDRVRKEPRESLVWRVHLERPALLDPRVLLANLVLRV